MPKRTISYDCYEYEQYRQNINHYVEIGAVLVKHLTWFEKGGELDRQVIDQLKKKNCIVILRDDEGTGKLVGVVSTRNSKNSFGVNTGSVVEVIYDRDDRDSKQRLIKVKNFFSGSKSKGYVDNFTQFRQIYNTAK